MWSAFDAKRMALSQENGVMPTEGSRRADHQAWSGVRQKAHPGHRSIGWLVEVGERHAWMGQQGKPDGIAETVACAAQHQVWSIKIK
jgi:hypothetical protein